MNKAITEIRGLDSKELRSKLQDLRKEQFGLRFRGSPEEVKKTTRHSEVRRTIARILMVLGERDRGAAVIPAPQPAAKGKDKGKAAKAAPKSKSKPVGGKK
jgi:large subunit ribosomal protein L29